MGAELQESQVSGFRFQVSGGKLHGFAGGWALRCKSFRFQVGRVPRLGWRAIGLMGRDEPTNGPHGKSADYKPDMDLGFLKPET
jgi:hypothetical protein